MKQSHSKTNLFGGPARASQNRGYGGFVSLLDGFEYIQLVLQFLHSSMVMQVIQPVFIIALGAW